MIISEMAFVNCRKKHNDELSTDGCGDSRGTDSGGGNSGDDGVGDGSDNDGGDSSG